MDRERLMEIIDSNGRFNLPTVELEAIADHLIANGIGDITAEKHRAGYRKQSETVKEFIKDVKNIYAGRNDKEKHTMIAFLFTQLDKLAEQYGKEEK